MNIEEKLDDIIKRLTVIEEKLSGNSLEKADADLTSVPVKIRKPNPQQLFYKEVVWTIARQCRLDYLKAIKMFIDRILFIQSKNRQWDHPFVPQCLKGIDEKIRVSKSTFYVELKREIEEYAEAVTKEGAALVEKLRKRGGK